MGLTLMTTNTATDPDNPDHVRARAYVCIVTLDKCRSRLVTQRSNASTIWKEQLTEVTMSYREIVRDGDEKNTKAMNEKSKAKAFDKVVKLLGQRDKLEADKSADLKERAEKISLVEEAMAEAMAYQPGDSRQLEFLRDASRVDGMPWATDKALGIIYTALRDLEQSGATLDDYQRALLVELADASIEGEDLGLEAAAAVEDESTPGDMSEAEAELDAALDDVDDDGVF